MSVKTPISVAYGDGIGPEIMDATLKVLEAAHAQIEIDVIEIGKNAYLSGNSTGIPDAAWASLYRTKVLLKSPITTPQGGGYKSLNVTLRKTLGMYANVRPTVSYSPYVPTKFPGINLVIIRENEEDLYSGIEHRQADEVYQCLKLISRQGCEQIIRYAFEFALKYNRKRVTCFSKDNIMKMTDGLFHRVFDEIAGDYPTIEHNHLIVDIGTALLATQPERFDIIVTLNLYGDIISDVAAQVAGSVGLAGSANIGHQTAMFEAIHGSAPDIADKNIANPSGLINAAVQMLVHINQPETAAIIENAWLKTIEDGIHTGDIYSSTYSKMKVGTKEFAQAIIDRLGQKPAYLKPVDYKPGSYAKVVRYTERPKATVKKVLVGVDVFLDNDEQLPANNLAEQLLRLPGPLKLIMIASKGLKIWPESKIETPFLTHCACRFQSADQLEALHPISYDDIIELVKQINGLGLEVIKTENLYTFDGQIGFSLAQGQ